MAGQVVQMDYSVISDVSKGFSTASQVLTTIGKVLETMVEILRATAFFSMGTSAALATYLDNIKSKVNNLAQICENRFAQPLMSAIGDHRKGDVQGKSYFGKPLGG